MKVFKFENNCWIIVENCKIGKKDYLYVKWELRPSINIHPKKYEVDYVKTLIITSEIKKVYSTKISIFKFIDRSRRMWIRYEANSVKYTETIHIQWCRKDKYSGTFKTGIASSQLAPYGITLNARNYNLCFTIYSFLKHTYVIYKEW